MIERIKGRLAFVCDDCDDGLETDEADFARANAVRAEAGWTARQEDGDWVHRCKDCSA